MKRSILLIAGIIAVAMLTTSCLKTRVCECKSVADPTQNYNYTYDMVGKTVATADCENQESSGKIYAPDYTCELK